MRQSSSSTTSAEKLKELIQSSTEIKGKVRVFWIMSGTNMIYMLDLSKSIHMIRALWNESLIDCPNSSVHSEGYCNFLIECTDFSKAIIQKHRLTLIDVGREELLNWSVLQTLCSSLSSVSQEEHHRHQWQQREEGEESRQELLELGHEAERLQPVIIIISDWCCNWRRNLKVSYHTWVPQNQRSTNNKKAKNSKRLEIFILTIAAMMLFTAMFVFLYFRKFFDQGLSMTESTWTWSTAIFLFQTSVLWWQQPMITITWILKMPWNKGISLIQIREPSQPCTFRSHGELMRTIMASSHETHIIALLKKLRFSRKARLMFILFLTHDELGGESESLWWRKASPHCDCQHEDTYFLHSYGAIDYHWNWSVWRLV